MPRRVRAVVVLSSRRSVSAALFPSALLGETARIGRQGYAARCIMDVRGTPLQSAGNHCCAGDERPITPGTFNSAGSPARWRARGVERPRRPARPNYCSPLNLGAAIKGRTFARLRFSPRPYFVLCLRIYRERECMHAGASVCGEQVSIVDVKGRRGRSYRMTPCARFLSAL